MKSTYPGFSVIALDAKKFQSAKQCRMLTDTSQQHQIAREMIASLESVMNQEELIDRYVACYADFPILAITYTKEFVKLSLSEQHSMLKTFIEETDPQKMKDRYEDICTGYINMKSSLFFPELWPHPYHNLPRMISFSSEYIALLSSDKKGSIKRSKIFEVAPDTLMDNVFFWELTGIQKQHSLDNSFLLVSKDFAMTMLDEMATRTPGETLREEHARFTSFLEGVVRGEAIVVFEYSD